MNDSLLKYSIDCAVDAFSTRKDSVLPYPVILGSQVHDVKTAVIKDADPDQSLLEGVDALVTNLKGVALGVRTADCVPILLFDPENMAIAAIHAGWKGTLRRIVNSGIAALAREYGTKAGNLKAVIGPCISGKSFQVGEEIPNAFKELGFPIERIYSWNGPKIDGEYTSGHHIDLVETNVWLMELCGIQKDNILCCGIDTFTDGSFYSARRDGTESGRIITAIKLL